MLLPEAIWPAITCGSSGGVRFLRLFLQPNSVQSYQTFLRPSHSYDQISDNACVLATTYTPTPISDSVLITPSMAGKKAAGENTKKAAGNAKKAEAAAGKKAAADAKAEANESKEWQKGAKDNSKAYAPTAPSPLPVSTAY